MIEKTTFDVNTGLTVDAIVKQDGSLKDIAQWINNNANEILELIKCELEILQKEQRQKVFDYERPGIN